jgi:hypothetical protein
MPYIESERRSELRSGGWRPQTPGELNYVITKYCTEFIEEYGTSYNTLNAVLGVLSAAQLELYRRVVAPYEDVKCKENGDAYTTGDDDISTADELGFS